LQRAKDNEPAVREEINKFYANIRSLHDYYEYEGIHINADQDPNTVYELLESNIVNPNSISLF
jgi:adenylate kinase family enzyme